MKKVVALFALALTSWAGLQVLSPSQTSLDLSQYELKLIFEADFSQPLNVIHEDELFEGEQRRHLPEGKDWVFEGKGRAWTEEGRLHIESLQDSHVVLWNTRVFPENFLLEFEMSPHDSSNGLAIVFFSTTSREGGGIFDLGHPRRDGIFKNYHSAALNGYHASYWAGRRGTANLRKNHGFHVVSSGTDHIGGQGPGPHRVRLLKSGGRISLETRGALSLVFDDDGVTHGPVWRAGQIGLRQMAHTERASYTSFKVWEIHERRDAIAAAGPLEVFPTFHSAGVRTAITGDANINARARLAFRRLGGQAWRQAFPPARISGNRFAGSIFNLEPDTQYEARLSVEDVDGVAQQPEPVAFRTPAEKFPTGQGRAWYVEAGAAGDGTKERPLSSIQQAVDAAAPGDVITVLPGIYRESVLIAGKRGRPDAYILIKGEPGVVVSGSLQELEHKNSAGGWTSEGDGIFSTQIAADAYAGYVAAGEQRLYRYWELVDLRRRAAGVQGGWYWEQGRLYVALADGENPHNASMRAAGRPYGLRLENSHYLIVEGLDLGYFGAHERRERTAGIALHDSSNIVIRNNRIHHCNRGISTDGAATTRILIEGNEIFDTSIIGWPWDKVKATEAEGSAVSLKGGPGQVVRRNTIHGYFNGVVASTWGDLQNEALNSDVDIYENQLHDIGDDPLEPEGTCINLRIWSNRMRDCLTGVSLAPITVGPVYFLRNTSFQYWGSTVKLASGIENAGPKYILHNTFVSTLRQHRRLDGTLTDEGVNALMIWPSNPRRRPFPDRPMPVSFWANATFLNNIFYGTGQTLEAATLKGQAGFDYNNFYTEAGPAVFRLGDVTYQEYAAFQEAGFEQHGLNIRSKFVNLKSGDLRLSETSPEIDRALPLPNISDDFAGKAPDIGAIERR
ncbi:MAG: DUF1961 family protein [Acidobacteriota bacterium]